MQQLASGRPDANRRAGAPPGFVRLAAALAGAAVALAAVAVAFPAELRAQVLTPYRPDDDWGRLPGDRQWGAVTGVMPAPDGGLWALERCGANSCLDRPGIDPVVKLNAEGEPVKSFGADMFSWPHGFYLDDDGNLWVTDAEGFEEVEDGKGHAVYKFSPDGELLMTLGEPGVPGSDRAHFDSPSDVVVAEDGSVFVADGHGAEGNNRVVKFGPDGTFLREWGGTGVAPGEFRDPHALALDSRGRLFVGDRGNSRIQIFTREGEFLESWTQFGRPSGIYITDDDVILVADSESNARRDQRGWARGIRIGSARDGWVRAFIPDDTEPSPNGSPTSGAEWAAMDAEGNVYGGEIGPRNLQRWVPLYPVFR